MSNTSPFYFWDRCSPGWLATLEQRLGRSVTPDDVNHILAANPDAAVDPALQPYLERLRAGELNAPRGRPTINKIARMTKVMLARDEFRKRSMELRALRHSGSVERKAGDLEPSSQAANEVAARWGFGCGRSLQNAMSALQKHWLFCE